MSLELPKSIVDYLAASNARDANAVAHCFTDDAVVRDESRDRRGIDEILAWKAWTEEKYAPIVEALDVAQSGERTIVTCKVSGTFPGSPINLKYGFTLKDGKIARLEIVP
jgi:ketosteroid isomerase-like protein